MINITTDQSRWCKARPSECRYADWNEAKVNERGTDMHGRNERCWGSSFRHGSTVSNKSDACLWHLLQLHVTHCNKCDAKSLPCHLSVASLVVMSISSMSSMSVWRTWLTDEKWCTQTRPNNESSEYHNQLKVDPNQCILRMSQPIESWAAWMQNDQAPSNG